MQNGLGRERIERTDSGRLEETLTATRRRFVDALASPKLPAQRATFDDVEQAARADVERVYRTFTGGFAQHLAREYADRDRHTARIAEYREESKKWGVQARHTGYAGLALALVIALACLACAVVIERHAPVSRLVLLPLAFLGGGVIGLVNVACDRHDIRRARIGVAAIWIACAAAALCLSPHLYATAVARLLLCAALVFGAGYLLAPRAIALYLQARLDRETRALEVTTRRIATLEEGVATAAEDRAAVERWLERESARIFAKRTALPPGAISVVRAQVTNAGRFTPRATATSDQGGT